MCRNLIVGLLVCLASAPAHATFWDVEPVYGGPLATGDASIAVGPGSVPSISYSTDLGLYLATKTVNGWTSSYVAATGFSGGYSSLAIDLRAFSPQPCIAYIDGGANYLKYAYKSGGTWHFETVDDVGWLPDYVSLAFNSSGQACIAYCRTSGSYPDLHTYVSFARRTGINTWSKQDIEEIGDVTGPAMAMNGDMANITYSNPGAHELKLASGTGTGPWQIELLDGGPTTLFTGYTAVTVGPGGSVDVAYFRRAGVLAELRYLQKSGSRMTGETVTTVTPDYTCYCSLVVTPGDIPLIGYFEQSTGALKNAWKSGGMWFTEEIDPLPPPGKRISMALDSLGNVDVGYYDQLNDGIKFAWAPVPFSIRQAKTLADGVTVQVSGTVASSAQGEIADRVYVQNADRSCGIQLYFPGTVPPVTRGMALDIQGTMTTIGGERAIDDPDLVQIDASPTLRHVGMGNPALGGTSFHYSAGPPASGQKGVVGGVGLNNIGLLVRAWGRVTDRGTGWFTIDDGSDVQLKCYCPGISLPALESYVIVTGISSCEQSGSNLLRMLRVRDGSDILTVTP